MKLQSREKSKKYYNVNYDIRSEAFAHIPDFRTQLFWESNLNLSELETPIEFFTSEEIGLYKIFLQGVTLDGAKIGAPSTFQVY